MAQLLFWSSHTVCWMFLCRGWGDCQGLIPNDRIQKEDSLCVAAGHMIPTVMYTEKARVVVLVVQQPIMWPRHLYVNGSWVDKWICSIMPKEKCRLYLKGGQYMSGIGSWDFLIL